jgi:hypothetical protein
MNIQKNARATPQSRALPVHRVLREHWPVSAVAMLLVFPSVRSTNGWRAIARKGRRVCAIAGR